MNQKIFIAGAGGIGQAAAVLLREWADVEIDLILGNISEQSAQKAKEFVLKGSAKKGRVQVVVMAENDVTGEMKEAFEASHVILDCAPGSQAPRMARFARDFSMHYANLTEYVAETDEIMRIAAGSETGFILQTGLAPGFINVLANSLYDDFVSSYENEKVESISMKVGALTAHAHAPHYYGFTWSPIGVATEYVKNSRVIRDYRITELPALSERERIVIGGRGFEADLTSGGAADLPDFFENRSRSLDYKTLRHIGHYDWVNGVIREFPKDERLPERVLERFLKEIPAVEDDFVLAHAAVEGFDKDGIRRLVEKAFFVNPADINGHRLRAIQTSTAAPLCESAMMLLSGKQKGVVLQSDISPKEFLSGGIVSRVYR